ncbi:MAG: hypothetical protein L3J63_10125, partial [Geopsychrobacter sp.]|nr:hypothetical protein [Geopsychrobacter sp.]
NNPVPDQTFDPSIPAANAHIFSVGGEYELDSWRLAIAYAYQRYESRDKDNAVGLAAGGAANGRYQTASHMLALDLLYRF